MNNRRSRGIHMPREQGSLRTPTFRRGLAWALAYLIVLACAWVIPPARAHVTATGLATVEIREDVVLYSLALLLNDVPELSAHGLSAAAHGDATNAERVATLLRDAVSLTAGEESCRAGRARVEGGQPGDGKVRLELEFSCPKHGAGLTLREDFRPLFGEHYRSIVSVRGAQGSREYVLGEGGREARLDLAAPAGGWGDFLRLGIEHILNGFDHLLFLLALLVNQRRIWSVVRIVTAFTLAHSITLSLAALSLVALPDRVVEPLIAASIVWVALENLLFKSAEWRRAGVAFLFGLVHGLGFAGVLTDLALSGGPLVRALVGFNLGVELGQVACVVVVLPLIAWASRPAALIRLPQAASILVALVGAFWFVERVFFN